MDDRASPDALVIGAGPAGLMAAEALSAASYSVLVAEAKPSIGRKFLMAGKSGLNLTKAQSPEDFIASYHEGSTWLAPMLSAFGPEEVVAWATALGQPCFTGSSGRVFPHAMKASPLLRAWRNRLGASGVTFRTGWRWQGFEENASRFDTAEGPLTVEPRVTVLALGGGSWARLGSDGAWVPILRRAGVDVAPFRASNVGFRVAWSDHMVRHAGAAVKPLRLSAGAASLRAEIVIGRDGIEGGGIYALAHLLRDGAALTLDLLPDRTPEAIAAALARPRGKETLTNHLRKRLGLSPVKIALLRDCAPEALGDPSRLAARLKSLSVPLLGPHPLDEAISTAGGVTREAVTSGLMLRARPGTFCAGEMLDWDAPTGGYLISACLATGRHAGLAAADHIVASTG